MPWSLGNQTLALSLLVLPTVLFSIYFIVQFPGPPLPTQVHHSLAGLPESSLSWNVYPLDFYDGGNYVTLPYGRTRYWLFGPKGGKKIILIHGFSVPAIIWKDVAPVLASKGYRVLVYDLYGRGYSDAPQTTYNTSLYTMQLALLMQHLKWERAHIAGVSMGSAIAAAFAADFPDLVEDKIVLLCAAGLLEPNDISRTMKFMSSPVIQSVASSPPFRMYLSYLARKSTENSIAKLVRIQSAHLPGYNGALGSSLRHGPIRGLQPYIRALRESSRSVLIIWGTQDNTIPYKYSEQWKNLLPDSELVIIEGGPHDLTLSHPRDVVRELVRWFGEE